MTTDEANIKFDAYAAASFQSTIASPVRLQVMHLLLQKEWAVGLLAVEVGLSQSALSQHLNKLRDARLVSTRRCQQRACYRSVSGRVETIMSFLETLDYHP